MHLRFAVHIAEQATRLRVGDPALGVHPYAAHEGQVEHQRAVGRGQARDVVPATFDAEQEVVVARELHARDHVGAAEAARDGDGPSIDHGVPNGSGLFVAGLARQRHGSPEPRFQTVDGVPLQVDLATLCRCRSHGRGSFSSLYGKWFLRPIRI